MATKKKARDLQEAFESILQTLIDEWYERVSDYYVTEPPEGDAGGDAELKRFHDENGHRLKFNKDNLDFTYGLRATRAGDEFHIDISVNNKVDDFDYEDFKKQLFDHYQTAGKESVKRPAKLKNLEIQEVLQLESGISEAFTVEKRGDRADIMRLSFRIDSGHLEILASDPASTKQLIESYCVSPFRKIYARVYRAG